MSIKQQGTELNKTLTVFFNVGDVGSFNRANMSIVLKGDAYRKLFVTGFSFCWLVGIAADVGANGFSEFNLIENFQANPDSNIPIIPDTNGNLRQYFAQSAPAFANRLSEQFDTPFPLNEGVIYSAVAAVVPGVTPITATITARLTVFGFEENEAGKTLTMYSQAR